MSRDHFNLSTIRRIIFLSATEFTERDYLRFGIEILRKNGFVVDIWNGEAIMFPHYERQIVNSGRVPLYNQRIFLTVEDLTGAIAQLGNDTIVICLLALNIDTMGVFRSFSRYKTAYCVYHANSYPIPKYYYQSTAKYRHYLSRITKIGFRNLIVAVLNKVVLNYYPYFGITPAPFVIVGGTRSTAFVNTPIDSSTYHIRVHATDYDACLNEKKNHDSITGVSEDASGKLCVFIDTYSPTDPDRFYHGADSTYSPTEKYYRDMRSLFDYIERTFGYRIVISSHPTMHKDANAGSFGERERIYGKTANYVKKASCVLSHESTAVSFAVFFRKPILFLTSEEIDKMPNGQNIRTMASIIGRQLVYIDSPLNFTIDALLHYDKARYDDYIHQYLSQTGCDLLSWQIFSDFLKKGTGNDLD